MSEGKEHGAEGGPFSIEDVFLHLAGNAADADVTRNICHR